MLLHESRFGPISPDVSLFAEAVHLALAVSLPAPATHHQHAHVSVHPAGCLLPSGSLYTKLPSASSSASSLSLTSSASAIPLSTLQQQYAHALVELSRPAALFYLLARLPLDPASRQASAPELDALAEPVADLIIVVQYT